MIKEEIVGEKMEVLESNNKGLVGLSGEILDETKNTIVLGNGSKKTIPKLGSTFKIGNKIVAGENLAARSEDRIKRK